MGQGPTLAMRCVTAAGPDSLWASIFQPYEQLRDSGRLVMAASLLADAVVVRTPTTGR